MVSLEWDPDGTQGWSGHDDDDDDDDDDDEDGSGGDDRNSTNTRGSTLEL